MNKTLKNQISQILTLIEQTHTVIEKKIKKNKDGQVVLQCLEDCQQAAITIGTSIEKTVKNETKTIELLENYCELVYNLHEKILARDDNLLELYQVLNECFMSIRKSIEVDISVKKEIVFLPYKASMWDSLESVWRKANESPECDAKVIPIPYYDKNPDGTFGEFHYEGELYPEDVPTIFYEDYNFELNKPDEIYIHNPYDGNNFVTSVHPFFYSKNLKKFTEKLIYIPYFVLEEPDLNNKCDIEEMEHFIQTPAVIHADEVIVQSENMRQCYIEAMVKIAGENSRKIWEKKILGTGSPKFDRAARIYNSEVVLPEDWEKKIMRADGTRKKVILYNTGVSALLKCNEDMLDKIERVQAIFHENQADVTLLWRPHPLVKATISSLRPVLWDKYNALVERYCKADWGIYDDSPDLDRAIAIADAYYGDASSVVQLCQSVGLPVMLQNVDI